MKKQPTAGWMRHGRQITALLGLLLALLHAATLSADEPTYRSPESLVVSPDGKLLYVAEATARRVDAVETASGKVARTYILSMNPSGLAVAKSGNLLYITAGGAEGGVFLLDVESGKITGTVTVGHTPMAPVLSQDGQVLYVCNRFNNEVMAIDLASRKAKTRIPVTREPVAAMLAPDGKVLFVANHLPAGPANVSRMTSVIDVIDTATDKVADSIPLPNGAVDLHAMCLSPDGSILYVPSTIAHFMLSTTQVERGWMNSYALNLIDVKKRKFRYSVPLDDENLGAANPWGVACTPDGKYVCVAHSATHEVSLIDQPALLAKLAKAPRRDESRLTDEEFETLADNPADYLAFMLTLRKRVKLAGNGPRGIAVAGAKLYVAEYFSGSVGIVDLDSADHPAKSLALGPEQPMNLRRKGEVLFHDASTMCREQWQSCSSCHPDGRMDAVNWDLLNDGIGNPKSTKSMLFAVQTPPMMARGERANAAVAIRSGMKYIQFMEPKDESADALHEYIKCLEPVPSPFLVGGGLSKAAERGKTIFQQALCAACHSGQYYTDLKLHEVGTGDGVEKGVSYVTPTLREVWRTAPYLHDGRAATIEEMLTKFNQDNRHGHTSELGPEALSDLVSYVNSL